MSRFRRVLAAVRHLPEGFWRPAVAVGAPWVALCPPRGVRQWRENARVVLGREPSRAETARAVSGWARNLVETAQLQDWPGEQVLGRVEISPADRERLARAWATSPGGIVIALPHMGSWDLAGAWACLSGMPVSTVAEELDDADFSWFVAARSAVGMRVHGHRDPRVLPRLREDLAQGRLVCLVADRQLGEGGIRVQWRVSGGARTVRLPGGPAHLARRTDAVLLAAACHYLPRGRMRLVISQPVAAGSLAAMTQQLADFFSAQVLADVTDWHVLQPFFGGDDTP